jgi:WG containing repeat
MLSILKVAFSAISAITLLLSCTENTGGSTGHDNISDAVIPPPSNELMTAKLQMQLKDKYDNVWDYSDGMIAVMKNDKYGFCDSTGKEVIPCLYDNPSNFREGVADVKKDGMIGFIDKTGKELFPFRKYDYAGGFEDGLSSFRIIKDGKELYGFVDKTGNEVVPPIYSEVQISWFDKGRYAIVQKGGKWGTISKQNAVVIPFEYDAINDFNNGITTAQKAGKWGVIDTANKVLVPFTMVYKTVYEFSNGYAHVENDKDMEGYIGTDGKEAFGGLKYSEAFPFGENGYAIVSEENSNRYMIDKQGSPVLKDASIKDITPIDNNMFIITRNGKQGIVDKDNKVLLPIEYTSIMGMGKNLMLVVKDSLRYYADYKGNKVAEYTE